MPKVIWWAACFALLASSFPARAGGELWGHLRYQDARRLVDASAAYPVNAPPSGTHPCRVHPDVLPPLKRLLLDASLAGHQLIAHSCFRSVNRQVDVFLAGVPRPNAPREGDLAARAHTSAPPGFSEHHTGFAIDFCDGGVPETCDALLPNFELTPAGAWLITHGPAYGFEMSFPDQSSACVKRSARPARSMAYEPWHWRFVASEEAMQVFAEARERFAVCPQPGAVASRAVPAVTSEEDDESRFLPGFEDGAYMPPVNWPGTGD